MRNLFIFVTLIAAFHSQATTFSPVTIRDQVKSATGIVQGEVVAVSSERDEKLGIVSKVFIKADKWMGATVENDHIEIYFPGGSVGDEGKVVHGTPKFSPGEKIIVLTKSHDGRAWVQNLGLGKFSVKKVGRSEIIVNQIFPKVPNVGQMPLKTFYSLAKNIKDAKFRERYKDKYERATEKSMSALPKSKVSRSIASTGKSSPVEKPSPLWLVFLLGAIGTGARLSWSKKGQ